MSNLCPNCNSFLLEDYIWWVSGVVKIIQIGGARSAEIKTNGSNQTGSWLYKQVRGLIRPRSSKRMQSLRACAET